MQPSKTRVAAVTTALAALASGCAQAPTATQRDVRTQLNPAVRAERTITSFTPALRCMDELLYAAGVRDVTMMMEEMRDATQRVPIAARDMMVSAMSEMTRRSRAVRLSVFGSDQNNLAQLLREARRTNAFAVLPEYGLRGTVSQFDDEVRRDAGSFGLTLPLIGARFGSDSKASVLGFDAAVVRTETFTLVPGVASKNTTVLVRRDAGASDGQAQLTSGNAVFAYSTARSEGTAQAARNMVELALIELTGKLTRLPYWQCLGTRDDDAEVQREIEDWHLSMDEAERIGFVKERLRERRWYDGGLDAKREPMFELALAGYRSALGLPALAGAPLDLAFFRRFITQPVALGPLSVPARPARVAAAGGAAAATPAPVATAPVATATGATAAGATAGGTAGSVAPGAVRAATVAPPAPPPTVQPVIAAAPRAPLPLELRLSPAAQGVALELRALQAGYIYCYAQDPQANDGGAIRRIYPNRFARDMRVERGAAVLVPGKGAFVLDPHHDFACLHAAREVYGDLPGVLRWGDFDDVRLKSFEEIRARFEESAGMPVALVRAGLLPSIMHVAPAPAAALLSPGAPAPRPKAPRPRRRRDRRCPPARRGARRSARNAAPSR
jgi:hypothetical protein